MQSYVDTNGVGEIMITVTNRNANWKDNGTVWNESPNADKTRLQLKERERERKLLQNQATNWEEIMNPTQYE